MFFVYKFRNSENYFRYAYKFIYKSEEPYKILEDKNLLN